MHMCVYIYIYIYTHTLQHTCIYLYLSLSLFIYIYIHTHTYTPEVFMDNVQMFDRNMFGIKELEARGATPQHDDSLTKTY